MFELHQQLWLWRICRICNGGSDVIGSCFYCRESQTSNNWICCWPEVNLRQSTISRAIKHHWYLSGPSKVYQSSKSWQSTYLSNLTSKRASNEIVCQRVRWLGASEPAYIALQWLSQVKGPVLQFLLRFQVWEGLHWTLDQEEVFTHQKKLNAWGGALAAAG